MPRALITGTGMLGTALYAAAEDHGYSVQAISRAQLDLVNANAVRELILSTRPDLVLHTAALTRVNYCQQHPQEAQAINAVGTASLVAAAEKVMARVVYFSTDYVFDGAKRQPYVESDRPAPLNAYGASKRAGEYAPLDYFRGHVVRTSAVFGPRGNGVAERNFIRAIFSRLKADDDIISVVANQRTALTFAQHLANMVMALLADGLPKLCHLTSAGSNTWFEWAKLVAAELGLPAQRLRPVTAEEYDATTPRPAYSVLGSENPSISTLISMHPVLPALRAYCQGLLAAGQMVR